MERLIIALICVLLLAGCGKVDNHDIIGGADAPTDMYISGNLDVQYESKTIDKWGVYLTPYDVTPQGMTVCIEQFGGNATGELQTGSWYELQYTTGDGWTPLEPIIDNGVWTALAYGIKNNDVTEFDIDWQWLYGELPAGDYRLAKKIMDFRSAGDYDEKLYYVYFSIEG